MISPIREFLIKASLRERPGNKIFCKGCKREWRLSECALYEGQPDPFLEIEISDEEKEVLARSEEKIKLKEDDGTIYTDADVILPLNFKEWFIVSILLTRILRANLLFCKGCIETRRPQAMAEGGDQDG